MRTRPEIISQLTNPGIIAVVRAQRPEQIPALSEALLAGGVTAIEITMTTPNAVEALRHARTVLGERALLGMGTVLDEKTCRQALDAGAEYIVTPICRPSLVELAHQRNKPIMLGAFTPTEAQHAHEAGADFVKLFPADAVGPSFVKALRAPLPHLRIVPTGGVELGNVCDFLAAGCAALGIGSALVSSRILADENWPELTRRAAEFVKAAREARC